MPPSPSCRQTPPPCKLGAGTAFLYRSLLTCAVGRSACHMTCLCLHSFMSHTRTPCSHNGLLLTDTAHANVNPHSFHPVKWLSSLIHSASLSNFPLPETLFPIPERRAHSNLDILVEKPRNKIQQLIESTPAVASLHTFAYTWPTKRVFFLYHFLRNADSRPSGPLLTPNITTCKRAAHRGRRQQLTPSRKCVKRNAAHVNSPVRHRPCVLDQPPQGHIRV